MKIFIFGLTQSVVLAAVLAFATPTFAADSMGPPSKDYHDAMMKMDQDMMKDMTGDADHDFAMMMIPHHQGAIDMAKSLLKHGKDPALKKMAEETIPKQEKEIADLKRWLDTLK